MQGQRALQAPLLVHLSRLSPRELQHVVHFVLKPLHVAAQALAAARPLVVHPHDGVARGVECLDPGAVVLRRLAGALSWVAGRREGRGGEGRESGEGGRSACRRGGSGVQAAPRQIARRPPSE